MTRPVAADPEVAELVLAGSGFPLAGDGDAAGVRFAWEVPAEPNADVVWVATAPDEDPGVRVIAPAGANAWRLAPWPAADALFELDAVAGAVLVVGDDRGIASELDGRSLEVLSAPRLDRAQLQMAGVVVVAQDAGAPLPAVAPAVLAAGRVLVTTRCEPVYGLRPGIDHLSGDGPEEIADLATSAALHWEAFGSMRTYARIAAERHRAARVLSDLLLDLELGL